MVDWYGEMSKYYPKTYLKYPDEIPQTVEEVRAIAGKRLPSRKALIRAGYIKQTDLYDPRKEVDNLCPADMHVAGSGIVCYRRGLNPNTQANLKPENGNTFQMNNKEGEKRKPGYQHIREAFKRTARQIVTCPITQKKVEFAEALANMMQESLLRSFASGDDSLFNKLATDFRLSAGEIPTQKSEVKAEVEHTAIAAGVMMYPSRPQLQEAQEVKIIEDKGDD